MKNKTKKLVFSVLAFVLSVALLLPVTSGVTMIAEAAEYVGDYGEGYTIAASEFEKFTDDVILTIDYRTVADEAYEYYQFSVTNKLSEWSHFTEEDFTFLEYEINEWNMITVSATDSEVVVVLSKDAVAEIADGEGICLQVYGMIIDSVTLSESSSTRAELTLDASYPAADENNNVLSEVIPAATLVQFEGPVAVTLDYVATGNDENPWFNTITAAWTGLTPSGNTSVKSGEGTITFVLEEEDIATAVAEGGVRFQLNEMYFTRAILTVPTAEDYYVGDWNTAYTFKASELAELTGDVTFTMEYTTVSEGYDWYNIQLTDLSNWTHLSADDFVDGSSVNEYDCIEVNKDKTVNTITIKAETMQALIANGGDLAVRVYGVIVKSVSLTTLKKETVALDAAYPEASADGTVVSKVISAETLEKFEGPVAVTLNYETTGAEEYPWFAANTTEGTVLSPKGNTSVSNDEGTITFVLEKEDIAKAIEEGGLMFDLCGVYFTQAVLTEATADDYYVGDYNTAYTFKASELADLTGDVTLTMEYTTVSEGYDWPWIQLTDLSDWTNLSTDDFADGTEANEYDCIGVNTDVTEMTIVIKEEAIQAIVAGGGDLAVRVYGVMVQEASLKGEKPANQILNISNLPTGDITEVTSYEGFTLMASSEKNMVIEDNQKNGDNGLSFTRRLKLVGAGNLTNRSVSFTTNGAATVTVYAMSSSATEDRVLVLASADGTELYRGIASGTLADGVIPAITYEISEAGTYYLWSAVSSINIYYIGISEGTEVTEKPDSQVLNISNLPTGDITEATSYEGFTLIASSEKILVIDENNKSGDNGIIFTKRMKLGGAGSIETRNINFTTSGAATITVYAMSASSEEDRVLILADANSTELGRGTAVAAGTPVNGILNAITYEVSEAGTYYLWSEQRGINVYYVEVTEKQTSEEPGEDTNITGNIIVDDTSNPNGLVYVKIPDGVPEDGQVHLLTYEIYDETGALVGTLEHRAGQGTRTRIWVTVNGETSEVYLGFDTHIYPYIALLGHWNQYFPEEDNAVYNQYTYKVVKQEVLTEKITNVQTIAWDDSKAPGWIVWEPVEEAGGYYVSLYRDGSSVGGWQTQPEENTINMIDSINASGTYTVTISTYGGKTTLDSDKSGHLAEYVYTRPETEIATPTKIWWTAEEGSNVPTIAHWNPVVGAKGYVTNIEAYDAENPDGPRLDYIGFTVHNTETELVTYRDFSWQINVLNNRAAQEGKTYTYRVTVQALSGNVELLANSLTADFMSSREYKVQEKIEEEIKEELMLELAAGNAISSVVDTWGKDEFGDAMKSDSELREIMEDAESCCGVEIAAPVVEETLGIAMDSVEVIGAGMNAESGTVGLVVKKAKDTISLNKELYHNVTQMEITLEHEDASGSTTISELDVPMVIIMPAPKDIEPERLVILHEHEGVVEPIYPEYNAADDTITFPVTGFSTFAFAGITLYDENGKEAKEYNSDTEPVPTTKPEYNGVDYSAIFNAEYYAQHNTDVVAVFGNSVEALLKHFVENGMAEGRQANVEFNVYIYLSNYEDIAAAFGSDLAACYMHYITDGKSEGRNAATAIDSGNTPSAPSVPSYNAADYAAVFDAAYYVANHADIAAAFGSDTAAMLAHFVENGMAEGRQANVEFNVYTYLSNYEDIAAAFGSDLKSCYLHYISAGKSEGRNAATAIGSGSAPSTPSTPSYNAADYAAVFDAAYYAANHADIAAAFGNDTAAMLAHFVENGMAEGRQANAEFNVYTYLSNYEDIAAAFGNDLVACYTQYISNGQSEGRNAATAIGSGSTPSTPSAPSVPSYNAADYAAVFDAAYYAANYADIAAAFGNDTAAMLAHFVENGMAEGRQASASFNVYTYLNNYEDIAAAFGSDLVACYMHYITNGQYEGRNASTDM